MKSILRMEFEGTTYEYAQGSLMYQEAKVFQSVTHMTVGQWQTKLNTGDMDGFAALLWLVKQRAGERVSFDSMEFNVQDLMAGITEVDEYGNLVERDSMTGDVVALFAPDGTAVPLELPDPTGSVTTSNDAKKRSSGAPRITSVSGRGSSTG